MCLTDGGTFLEKVPRLPVLWVVPPGGRVLDAFPFGQASRLLEPPRRVAPPLNMQ
jgi:predicted metal-dependent peptidase